MEIVRKDAGLSCKITGKGIENLANAVAQLVEDGDITAVPIEKLEVKGEYLMHLLGTGWQAQVYAPSAGKLSVQFTLYCTDAAAFAAEVGTELTAIKGVFA